MNFFHRVGKPAITAQNNRSALHATIVSLNFPQNNICPSEGGDAELPQIESNLFKNSFLTDLFFHMCRLVLLSWLQFVQCLCILFLFYLTVIIACMICFYYNVCNCRAFIKGNLLTYLLTYTSKPLRHLAPSRVLGTIAVGSIA